VAALAICFLKLARSFIYGRKECIHRNITKNLFKEVWKVKIKFASSLSKSKSSLSKSNINMAKKILVVEDEGAIGLALDMILAERDFDLDYVNSLLDAGEHLEKNTPALVILDNKLPDGFGVDFISYIKKKYPPVKIIMISGFSTARDVAMENGADIFLDKPFSMEKVNEAIDSVLS
jgi:two-component system OmpR family response regulator